MKIAIFEIKDAGEKAYLRKALRGHSLLFVSSELNAQSAAKAKACDAVCVFIYSKVDAACVTKLPRLKLVVTRSTGFDHIDLKACAKRKITVSNVPFYGENTVAEHTFALILALSRNVHKSYVRTLRSDFSIAGLEGFDLKGKTLGVIGAGHIGLHVIRIARGFGMRVLAFDAFRNTFLAEVLGFEYVPLDTLLAKSDIITLHTPYLPQTHHLINKKNIVKVKKGAILINTARGALVDIDALIFALDRKILAGAGLDVLEGEELIKEEKQLLHDPKKAGALAKLMKDHAIMSRDNVVFTPHIGFYSAEALRRILETSANDIVCFAKGKPQNVVRG